MGRPIAQADLIASDARDDWRRGLQWKINRASGGRELAPTLTNATLLLACDTRFQGCWRWDSFLRRVVLARDLPDAPGLAPPKAPAVLRDGYVSYVVSALATLCNLSVPWETAARAIEAAAEQDAFNSLTAHLDGLEWDGIERLDQWLTAYLGVADAPYARFVGRAWLISAMARAYQPGCQADYTLVLEGPQRKGKSSALAILGGFAYLRKMPSVSNYNRASHAIQGTWIIEIGELDAFKGASATQVKDFLTLMDDHYHQPYGHYHVDFPRTCVFAGTTNERQYLHDATGGSRFWPARTGRLDLVALRRDRDCLLAEARDAYRSGEAWYPQDETMWKSLQAEQEDRYEAHAWEPIVEAWLDGGKRDSPRNGVTIGEILEGAIGIPKDRWDRSNQTTVGIILTRLGWVRREQKVGLGKKERKYFRPDSDKS